MDRDKLDGFAPRITLTLLLALGLGGLALAQGTKPPAGPPPTRPVAKPQEQFDTAGEAQIVDLVNQARAAAGVAPLTVDRRLTPSRTEAQPADGGAR